MQWGAMEGNRFNTTLPSFSVGLGNWFIGSWEGDPQRPCTVFGGKWGRSVIVPSFLCFSRIFFQESHLSWGTNYWSPATTHVPAWASAHVTQGNTRRRNSQNPLSPWKAGRWHAGQGMRREYICWSPKGWMGQVERGGWQHFEERPKKMEHLG